MLGSALGYARQVIEPHLWRIANLSEIFLHVVFDPPIAHTAGSAVSQCGSQCGMTDRYGGSSCRLTLNSNSVPCRPRNHPSLSSAKTGRESNLLQLSHVHIAAER